MKGYPSLIDVLWLIFSIFSGSVYHSFLSCGITPSVNHALQNFSQIPVKLMSLYLVSSTYFPSQSFRDSPILDPFLKKKKPSWFQKFYLQILSVSWEIIQPCQKVWINAEQWGTF